MKTAPYGNNGKRGQSKNEGANTGRPKSFKDVSKFAKTLSSQNPFTRRGFTSNDLDHSPSVSNQFSENNLLKATNVYQQFDKRGNIYENKLYVKTSINQVKLAQDHATYSKKMESKLEEDARINRFNGSLDNQRSYQMIQKGGDSENRSKGGENQKSNRQHFGTRTISIRS
jgi:hypothetical protein